MYGRESAVRELLDDKSFNYMRLHSVDFPLFKEQIIPCPKTCKNYVDESDCIDMPLFQECYIKQLLACLMVLQRRKIVASSCYFNAECFAGEEGLPSCCERQKRAAVQSYSDDMSTLALTHANPALSEAGKTFSHHQGCLSSFGRQAITLDDARRESERRRSTDPTLPFYSPNIIYLVRDFIKVVETLNGNALFENLCDGAEHMTASRQARSFYELLLKAAPEGLLLQDALTNRL